MTGDDICRMLSPRHVCSTASVDPAQFGEASMGVQNEAKDPAAAALLAIEEALNLVKIDSGDQASGAAALGSEQERSPEPRYRRRDTRPDTAPGRVRQPGGGFHLRDARIAPNGRCQPLGSAVDDGNRSARQRRPAVRRADAAGPERAPEFDTFSGGRPGIVAVGGGVLVRHLAEWAVRGRPERRIGQPPGSACWRWARPSGRSSCSSSSRR